MLFGDCISNYWSNILGKQHYKYNGVPLTLVNKAGTISYTFKLSTRADVAFMDKPFPNSDVPDSDPYVVSGVTYDHVLKKIDAVKANEDTVVEFEKKIINDKTNGDYIYIKVRPLEAGDVSTVTSVVAPLLRIDE